MSLKHWRHIPFPLAIIRLSKDWSEMVQTILKWPLIKPQETWRLETSMMLSILAQYEQYVSSLLIVPVSFPPCLQTGQHIFDTNLESVPCLNSARTVPEIWPGNLWRLWRVHTKCPWWHICVIWHIMHTRKSLYFSGFVICVSAFTDGF